MHRLSSPIFTACIHLASNRLQSDHFIRLCVPHVLQLFNGGPEAYVQQMERTSCLSYDAYSNEVPPSGQLSRMHLHLSKCSPILFTVQRLFTAEQADMVGASASFISYRSSLNSKMQLTRAGHTVGG